MRKIISILFLLVAIPTFGNTIYRPYKAEPYLIQVTGALNGAITTTGPKWAKLETSEVQPGESLKTVTFTLQCGVTTEYRSGKIHITVGISEYEFEIVQAGSLQVTTHAESVLTEQVKPADIRQVWFVPDDAEILPSLRYFPTREGTLFDIVARPGWLYVMTGKGIYSARLTYP